MSISKKISKLYIDPDSHIRLAWDIIVLIALIFNMIYIPYEITFVDQNY